MKIRSPKIYLVYLFFGFPILLISQDDPIRALGKILKARETFKQSTTEFHQGFYDQSLLSGHLSLRHIYDAEELLKDNPVKQVKFTTNILKAHGSNSLGIIYQYLEDLSAGKNYLEEAQILYQEMGLKREQAFVLTNLGMCFLQEEDYSAALDNFGTSGNIFQELLIDKNRMIDSLYLFGHQQFYTGYARAAMNMDSSLIQNSALQMEAAMEFLSRHAEEVVERQELALKIPVISLQAAKLDLEKDIFLKKEFILQQLGKSIGILEKEPNGNQSELGKLYAFKARYLLREPNNLPEATTYLEGSWDLLCGEESRDSINKKLIKGDLSIGSISNFLFALSNRAIFNFSVYQQSDDPKKLAVAYQDVFLAVQLMDQLITNYSEDYNLEVLLNRHTNLYQTAAAIITENYQKTGDHTVLEDLYYISEKQKSYVLRKAVSRKLLLNDLKESSKKELLKGDSLLKNLKTINSSIIGIKLSDNTDSLSSYIYKERRARNQYNDWLSDLKNTNYKLFSLLHENKVATFSNVKRKVKEDQSAIVEFIFDKQQIITLLITPILDTVIVKPRTVETDRVIEAYQKSMVGSYQEKLYRNNAFAAYKILFEQIDNILSTQDIQRIYLIPDGILHSVSFNAMMTDSKNDLWYNELSYLLNDYVFSRHFSATNMLQNSEQSSQFQQISFGAFIPDYSGYAKVNTNCKITPLTGNLVAAELMAENFENNTIFNRATVKDLEDHLEKFSILQLDMHGCIDFQNSDLSSLIFTYEDDETPFGLSLGAIYTKFIPADLVVLNACDTGSGKLLNGEGLISFGRAFNYAGSKSILMSLWKANNYAAQEVMKSFYTNLMQAKMTKDEALVNALRAYVRSKPKPPVDWANFIIMGNLDQLADD